MNEIMSLKKKEKEKDKKVIEIFKISGVKRNVFIKYLLKGVFAFNENLKGV